MSFENIAFIKPDRPLNQTYTGKNYAPQFRKVASIQKTGRAILSVCGLGYGLYYINGKPVTEDKFIAPVSDYTKTLWYTTYDVTDLLEDGENIFAAWLGNGWFNEEFKTSWNFDEAPWRDVPKFILELKINGETVLQSDGTWKCLPETAITFNALRSGEYFDARLYDENWNTLAFDDANWENAVVNQTPPTGLFRECLAEPIRECKVYSPISRMKTGEDRYVFDLGQNMSGYSRIKVKGQAGDTLVIRYAEQIKDSGELELNNMEHHYKESPFQTDKLTLSGKEITWSPHFTYHGFRYIEISGLHDPDSISVEGIFVHQAVDTRTEFACSDELLNNLFRMGQYSVWSNMFYMVTDCPTREKLGWANDAQSSTEQILTNFKAENLLEKWLYDIYDAMKPDGAMPGIIPTGGWGYTWGNGPVSDGVLFEIPYRLFLHTGNKAPLVRSLPWFDRYLAYLETRKEEDGYIHFGLNDWARPPRRDGKEEENVVPASFINAVLAYHFNEIAALAAEFGGVSKEKYLTAAASLKAQINKDFVNADGTSVIPRQAAVSMLIYYHLTPDEKPLASQLKKLVEDADFHHDCGMVGLRRLYYALNEIGLPDYAYKIITAAGYPSYRAWFDEGGTTLWEYWNTADHSDSKNHQMYSDFMSWIIKTLLGISADFAAPAYEKVALSPVFLGEISFAKGSIETKYGKLAVVWERKDASVSLSVTVPRGMEVIYQGKRLKEGENQLTL